MGMTSDDATTFASYLLQNRECGYESLARRGASSAGDHHALTPFGSASWIFSSISMRQFSVDFLSFDFLFLKIKMRDIVHDGPTPLRKCATTVCCMTRLTTEMLTWRQRPIVIGEFGNWTLA